MSTEAANVERANTLAIATAEASFEQLYSEHRLAILRFLVAFTSDEDAAIELALVTFERAWSECRRGRAVDLAWLLRCARNAAIDDHRRAVVRDRLSSLRSSRQAEASAEDVAVERDATSAIRSAVAKLPTPQRTAIVLRFTSNLRVREIAEVIGKSEDATEKLIARAVVALREELHDRV